MVKKELIQELEEDIEHLYSDLRILRELKQRIDEKKIGKKQC